MPVWRGALRRTGSGPQPAAGIDAGAGVDGGDGDTRRVADVPGLAAGTKPKVKLTGSGGTSVPVGKPVVADGSVVCAAVGPMHAGVVTLTYRVTASDGDSQTSAFQFEVADGARAAKAADACRERSLKEPVAAPAPDEGGTILGTGRSTGLAVLTVTGFVVVGGAALAARMRRRGGRTAEGSDT